MNLSSQLAHVGGADFAVYSGTKGFILTVTKSLAQEVGRFGITVNAICPGSIATAMNRHIYPPERQTKRAAELALRRMGDLDVVAGAALYLASPDGRVITGAVHRPPRVAEQRIKVRHAALAHLARRSRGTVLCRRGTRPSCYRARGGTFSPMWHSCQGDRWAQRAGSDYR
jgi:NAD(P)-dependent dehydrogenase (short-subunit alcohol dehydrogenase family)